MKKLEKEAYDEKYGLFTGPSVFNDGIAGYEEPIYEPTNKSSYVLDHPGSKTIKCLSTNCIYFRAYELLADMARVLGDKKNIKEYKQKASIQKENIRKYLYDKKQNRLNYLIDGNGKVHAYQEGLGISLAILFQVVTPQEAKKSSTEFIWENTVCLPFIQHLNVSQRSIPVAIIRLCGHLSMAFGRMPVARVDEMTSS